MLTRRTALGAAALLPGCAGWAGGEPERIVDVASGRELTSDDLLQRLRGADYACLGELHDNPWHHRRRGELLAALGPGTTVVAEHLPRGPRVALQGDLAAALAAAGFDARGWDWPVHEPLFAAIARAGLPLYGGNASRDTARQVARDGRSAVPPVLAALLEQAPLADGARAALDDDLVRGHCGQLAGARLDGMRWAQRTRDATMWLTLFNARITAGRGPAVLIAGNGHVRKDYGVPQIAARLQPAARMLSVGFAETNAAREDMPYDIAWITAPAQREDPCAAARR